jgi:cob(I)alamin adenosyltransferase
MAIYTKKGDRGETALYDPLAASTKRISKDSARINAIGAVDELNSSLGIAISGSSDKTLKALIKEVQNNLFNIGAILAGAKVTFTSPKTKKLEKIIERLEAKLPVLKTFIIPGGSETAARLFFARALVRRAERALVALNKAEEIKPEVLIYINRLSDLLFMLAREQNFKAKILEQTWKK